VRPLSWFAVTASITGLVLGARVMTGRRARPEPPPAPLEDAPPPAPARRPPVFHPAPPPPVAQAQPTGLSHLRGRVVVPAGTEAPDFDHLTVKADDGEREYEAKTNNRGEFQLHLPARGYTLTALVGDLVGTAFVRARPGTDEATIALQPSAAIEGTMKVPAGIEEVEVSATRTGTEISAGGDAETEGGHFELGGLVKGEVYDVTIEGRGLRKVVLRGITAPGTAAVELAALVTLRGAIGFAAGTACPIEHVSMETEDSIADAELDRHCRFSFAVAPGAEVELRASGGGWHLETRLRIPEHGDPEAVCLNPPCNEQPPEAPVSLQVILTGADSGLRVTVAQKENTQSCGGSASECELEGLAAGAAEVKILATGCAEVQRDVTLAPGANVVTAACRPLRLVEGVARRSDPRTGAVVSCQDGDSVHITGKSIFELHCPRDATAIRYRAAGQPWRSAALPPGAGTAFVELTL
jgi:hypothetical protein